MTQECEHEQVENCVHVVRTPLCSTTCAAPLKSARSIRISSSSSGSPCVGANGSLHVVSLTIGYLATSSPRSAVRSEATFSTTMIFIGSEVHSAISLAKRLRVFLIIPMAGSAADAYVYLLTRYLLTRYLLTQQRRPRHFCKSSK